MIINIIIIIKRHHRKRQQNEMPFNFDGYTLSNIFLDKGPG